MSTESPAMSTEIPAPPSPSLRRRLLDFDTSLSLHIHTACLPVPRTLLKTLEISGDGRFWFPIPISLLPFSSHSPILLALILGSLFDLLLIGLIKHLVRRPRPVYNKGMHLTFAVDHWSFPSGHSSRVFFIAAFLNLYADDHFRLVISSHRWAGLFLRVISGWSVATSASRVLLGRHFVGDVVVGACLGVVEAVIVVWLMSRIYLDR